MRNEIRIFKDHYQAQRSLESYVGQGDVKINWKTFTMIKGDVTVKFSTIDRALDHMYGISFTDAWVDVRAPENVMSYLLSRMRSHCYPVNAPRIFRTEPPKDLADV